MIGHVQRALAAMVALGVVSALGCGPVLYVNQVTRKASASVAAAKAADAQKYAPYHYTLAVEYLHKAREEASHADYQAANRFGRKAEEAARKAVELAVANAADPDYQPAEAIRGDSPGPGGGAGGDSGDSGDGMAPLLPGNDDGHGADDSGADDSDDTGADRDSGGMAPLLPDSPGGEKPDDGGGEKHDGEDGR